MSYSYACNMRCAITLPSTNRHSFPRRPSALKSCLDRSVMATAAAPPPMPPASSGPPAPAHNAAIHEKLKKGPGALGMMIFGVVLIVGVIYIGYSLSHDLIGVKNSSALPYILLGVALFVALAFEFVNGFHDTANAV